MNNLSIISEENIYINDEAVYSKTDRIDLPHSTARNATYTKSPTTSQKKNKSNLPLEIDSLSPIVIGHPYNSSPKNPLAGNPGTSSRLAPDSIPDHTDHLHVDSNDSDVDLSRCYKAADEMLTCLNANANDNYYTSLRNRTNNENPYQSLNRHRQERGISLEPSSDGDDSANRDRKQAMEQMIDDAVETSWRTFEEGNSYYNDNRIEQATNREPSFHSQNDANASVSQIVENPYYNDRMEQVASREPSFHTLYDNITSVSQIDVSESNLALDRLFNDDSRTNSLHFRDNSTQDDESSIEDFRVRVERHQSSNNTSLNRSQSEREMSSILSHTESDANISQDQTTIISNVLPPHDATNLNISPLHVPTIPQPLINSPQLHSPQPPKRRSMRLIEKRQRLLEAAEAETDTEDRASEVRRPVKRKRAKKVVKTFADKAIQTDEDEIMANINNRSGARTSRALHQSFYSDDASSRSEEAVQEPEGLRRSPRLLLRNKHTRSLVNIVSHWRQAASEHLNQQDALPNPAQIELDLPLNEEEESHYQLSQRPIHPLSEVQPSTSNLVPEVASDNVTIRRGHPAHPKNRGAKKSRPTEEVTEEEASEDDFAHLVNAPNVTLRRKRGGGK